MTTKNNTYPVTLRGELTMPPSRWVWLFKWLLAIPHCIVLFFLYFGSFFVGVFSFFSVLFAGKIPRGAFDYMVGVMRWSWRVNFYGLQVLGTDKYPPFSLDEDPSYPADLYVQYPDHLANGMVLVKWLLGIPHWIIIFAFQGGQNWIGAVPLLSLVCAVINLFTGKYPEDLFKVIIGMDRWTYRAQAYILLRDEYPPFKLEE